MKRHSFTKKQMLNAMRKVDNVHFAGRGPVGRVFIVTLAMMFRDAGVKFAWIPVGPDVKLVEPSRWWRDQTTGDLIVEQEA